MIEAHTYYDIHDLDRRLAVLAPEEFDRAYDDRFFSAVQQGEYGQDSLRSFHLEELQMDEDGEEFSKYNKILARGINLLVDAGELPKQDMYTIHIWW